MFADSGVLPRPDPANWFKEQIHVHEGQLKSYLKGTFPGVRDIDDVVQESYLRILRAKAGKPIESAKSFLFSVARHIAVDLVRRKRTAKTDCIGDIAELNVMDSGPGVLELLSEREKLDLLAEAIAELSPRCREVFLIHKIEGLSWKETALRLGVSPRTVEHQSQHGVRQVEKFLRSRGMVSYRK